MVYKDRCLFMLDYGMFYGILTYSMQYAKMTLRSGDDTHHNKQRTQSSTSRG